MFFKREWCRFVYVECTKFCVDFAVIYIYGAFSCGNISIRSRPLWFEFSSYMMTLLPFEYICFKSNNITAFFVDFEQVTAEQEICPQITKDMRESIALSVFFLKIINFFWGYLFSLIYCKFCFKFNVSKNEDNSYKVYLKLTQSTFTCSKLKIETLEQGVKYVQS